MMVEKRVDRKVTSSDKSAQKELSTMLNDQTIELSFVRNRLETFQATVLRDVHKRISGMIDEVMQELRQHELQTNEFHNFATPQLLQRSPSHKSNTWSNRVRKDSAKSLNNSHELKTNDQDNSDAQGNGSLDNLKDSSSDKSSEMKKKQKRTKKHQVLPEKIFVMRESFLTALLEVDHMKTIYHIFYIIFLVFLLNNVSYEYFVDGSVTFGLGVFRSGFAQIHKVAVVWMLQHIFLFGIFYSLKVWGVIRNKLTKHKLLQNLWSISCLFIYITSQLLFAYIPTKICLYFDLSFVTASVLLLESTRMLMKMHSFVKSIAPRIMEGKLKAEEKSGSQQNFPKFGKYLYFLFAPTLLYRDEYPRTSIIRWKFAFARFFEVVAVAFMYSYIYERHIKYHFGNFGKEEISLASITLKLFGMIMPSIIIFLAGFYMILHAWLNFTAEILRFGDRMFYKDWWTAGNYDAYYRNWNVVVHDWLYEYIYKDFYNYVFKGSKVLSSITVFLISALFHEYVLGYALQLVFPVMFFFFAIVGVAMIFVTRLCPKNLGNIFVWFSLIYGNTMIVSSYSMEYFTRINCPPELTSTSSWIEIFVPHLWKCYLR